MLIKIAITELLFGVLLYFVGEEDGILEKLGVGLVVGCILTVIWGA